MSVDEIDGEGSIRQYQHCSQGGSRSQAFKGVGDHQFLAPLPEARNSFAAGHIYAGARLAGDLSALPRSVGSGGTDVDLHGRVYNAQPNQFEETGVDYFPDRAAGPSALSH